MTNEIDISKVLLEGDTATIMGVKYKRVDTPQSFYNKLRGLLKTKLNDNIDCDETADKVVDLIKEHIPSLNENCFMSNYLLGFNEGIKQVEGGLFNGI